MLCLASKRGQIGDRVFIIIRFHAVVIARLSREEGMRVCEGVRLDVVRMVGMPHILGAVTIPLPKRVGLRGANSKSCEEDY